jgi:hypothetical protein
VGGLYRPDAEAEYLRGEFLRGKATERKMRLFACAWTRTIGAPALAYSAIKAAERFVDGQATRAEMAAARAALSASDCSGHSGWEYSLAGWSAALSACVEDAQWALTIDPSPVAVLYATPADKVAMCAQLREVFGNPCRPVVVSASWLTWNDGAVRRIAQLVYQEWASDQLPILADAAGRFADGGGEAASRAGRAISRRLTGRHQV